MPDDVLQCDVLTPDGRVFGGSVRHALIPAHDGLMGVLVNHAPMVVELGYGVLRLDTEVGAESWFIEGGFAQLMMDRAVILTRAALRLNQITRKRAEELLEQAGQIKVTDEVSARRRADIEANVRAQLRVCSG